MSSEESGLFVVPTSENFPQIHEGLAEQIISIIEDYDLAIDKEGQPNPKMVTQLLRRVTDEVRRHYAPRTKEYIARRFQQQVEKHIALGMHDHSVFSEEDFRKKLIPLEEKVQEYFMSYPPDKGEFSLLLVLPPKILPMRRQIATLINGYPLEDDHVLCTELELNTYGQEAPNDPYVLVGINAGRGLKEHSIKQADDFVRDSRKKYFSLHELIQLLWMRPHFLSRAMGLTTQSEVLALGEKHKEKGLVKLVAYVGHTGITFVPEQASFGGMGVGKPYYTEMIRM